MQLFNRVKEFLLTITVIRTGIKINTADFITMKSAVFILLLLNHMGFY